MFFSFFFFFFKKKDLPSFLSSLSFFLKKTKLINQKKA